MRKKLKPLAVPNRNLPGDNDQIQVLKAKDEITVKNNNRINRLPMRSSIRIAKKKSIESLSDSFVSNVNSKVGKAGVRERFSDKLKFMAKLQLKQERKENLSDCLEEDSVDSGVER